MGYITPVESFDFQTTLTAHGWYQLAPFHFEPKTGKLTYTYSDAGECFRVSVRDTGKKLHLDFEGDKSTAKRLTRRILRLDEQFEDWFEAATDFGFEEVERRKWGRLMRSPTVFEDLVKTICTTNCSWAFTKLMVNNLVESLGKENKAGRKAFPTPEEMALADEAFYRDKIKAGYRSGYLVKLSKMVADGELNPESWLVKELPTPDLKKEILSIKGVGNYAAENLLKLLGRYDGLALDSFLRGSFYKYRNDGKTCSDKKIQEFYRPFGDWSGLAIWFDMTEKRRLEASE